MSTEQYEDDVIIEDSVTDDEYVDGLDEEFPKSTDEQIVSDLLLEMTDRLARGSNGSHPSTPSHDRLKASPMPDRLDHPLSSSNSSPKNSPCPAGSSASLPPPLRASPESARLHRLASHEGRKNGSVAEILKRNSAESARAAAAMESARPSSVGEMSKTAKHFEAEGARVGEVGRPSSVTGTADTKKTSSPCDLESAAASLAKLARDLKPQTSSSSVSIASSGRGGFPAPPPIPDPVSIEPRSVPPFDVSKLNQVLQLNEALLSTDSGEDSSDFHDADDSDEFQPPSDMESGATKPFKMHERIKESAFQSSTSPLFLSSRLARFAGERQTNEAVALDADRASAEFQSSNSSPNFPPVLPSEREFNPVPISVVEASYARSPPSIGYDGEGLRHSHHFLPPPPLSQHHHPQHPHTHPQRLRTHEFLQKFQNRVDAVLAEAARAKLTADTCAERVSSVIRSFPVELKAYEGQDGHYNVFSYMIKQWTEKETNDYSSVETLFSSSAILRCFPQGDSKIIMVAIEEADRIYSSEAGYTPARASRLYSLLGRLTSSVFDSIFFANHLQFFCIDLLSRCLGDGGEYGYSATRLYRGPLWARLSILESFLPFAAHALYLRLPSAVAAFERQAVAAITIWTDDQANLEERQFLLRILVNLRDWRSPSKRSQATQTESAGENHPQNPQKVINDRRQINAKAHNKPSTKQTQQNRFRRPPPAEADSNSSATFWDSSDDESIKSGSSSSGGGGGGGRAVGGGGVGSGGGKGRGNKPLPRNRGRRENVRSARVTQRDSRRGKESQGSLDTPAATAAAAVPQGEDMAEAHLQQISWGDQVYNPKDYNLVPQNARFFIIKSYSEMDVQKSIKYGIWCSTEHGNRKLDQAFRSQNDRGPVLLFFSVNGSGEFCGMAEMIGHVNFRTYAGIWSDPKWKGKFDVKWIYVKNVPNHQLKHIRLENNDYKPVTSSRDTQEVPPVQAKRMLYILDHFKSTCSMLDNLDNSYPNSNHQSGGSNRQR